MYIVVVATTYVKYIKMHAAFTLLLLLLWFFVVAKLTLHCGVASHRVRFLPHFYGRSLRSVTVGGWAVVVTGCVAIVGGWFIMFCLYFCCCYLLFLKLMCANATFCLPEPIVMGFAVVKCVVPFVFNLIDTIVVAFECQRLHSYFICCFCFPNLLAIYMHYIPFVWLWVKSNGQVVLY